MTTSGISRRAWLKQSAVTAGGIVTGLALPGTTTAAPAFGMQPYKGQYHLLERYHVAPADMENLKASMEHLNQATSALAESSKKLDGVIEQADSAMASAKKAADGLQTAIADARKVLRNATQGKGLVAALLNDQQLANDLHALISNLRAHGVLFYRDSAAGVQAKPPGQTTSSRKARSR